MVLKNKCGLIFRKDRFYSVYIGGYKIDIVQYLGRSQFKSITKGPWGYINEEKCIFCVGGITHWERVKEISGNMKTLRILYGTEI